MMENYYRIRKTILALLTIFIFFFAQGAVVIMGGLEGVMAPLIQGVIIWFCAFAAIIIYAIKDHSLQGIGMRGMVAGSGKKCLYFVPLVVVALCSFAGGLEVSEPVFLLANLFLTLGVGFTEEIYFRGIICNVWKSKSIKSSVVISSVLFGVLHIMNVMGGAGIAETILQICFAFAYGVIMAVIFVDTSSIWPCILLHAFHDFCGFITADGPIERAIIVGGIQFIVLLGYCIFMIRRNGLNDN